MSRTVMLIALTLAAACQPKQPLQPSFFTAKQDANGPATCKQTLDCYADCNPLTEECMLLCDQRSEGHAVEKARAVSYCSAQHGCIDQACSDAQCAPQIEACVSPRVAPAPGPMQPQPYPGQAGGPSPTQPQPYPGQAGAPMQPQPYPGQPMPARYPGPPPPPPPPPPGYPPR